MLIPLYPFKYRYFWFDARIRKTDPNDEFYDFSENDLDIVCKTISFEKLFDLTYVSGFLRGNCNVQNPNGYARSDVTVIGICRRS